MKRKAPRFQCSNCKYNLGGLGTEGSMVSCPECGKPQALVETKPDLWPLWVYALFVAGPWVAIGFFTVFMSTIAMIVLAPVLSVVCAIIGFAQYAGPEEDERLRRLAGAIVLCVLINIGMAAGVGIPAYFWYGMKYGQ